jgi:hypothetical protein
VANLYWYSLLQGLQVRNLEFYTVFWVFRLGRIVDYDSTIADNFHNLTRNGSVFIGYKIADVDFHTVSFANECSCNM